MDDFYTKLEQGKIVPMMFWKDEVSKWRREVQFQLEVSLIGIYSKEEREGRYGSDLHRYAKHLADFISRQSNIQSQMQREQKESSTNADDRELPEILKHPEIRKEFDRAIQIGLLSDYSTLNPDKKKAPIWLLACFIWGLCKYYDVSTKAKSGKNKGGFAADWKTFDFIKDKSGKEIDLKQGFQNTKNKNYNPQKLSGFTFWEALCKELDISE